VVRAALDGTVAHATFTRFLCDRSCGRHRFGAVVTDAVSIPHAADTTACGRVGAGITQSSDDYITDSARELTSSS